MGEMSSNTCPVPPAQHVGIACQADACCPQQAGRSVNMEKSHCLSAHEPNRVCCCCHARQGRGNAAGRGTEVGEDGREPADKEERETMRALGGS